VRGGRPCARRQHRSAEHRAHARQAEPGPGQLKPSGRPAEKDRLGKVRDTGLVRVLVVDDDEAVRSALTHALHRDGYEVSTAGDGAAALAALLRLRHDAVVLDVLMPEPG